jgi:putative nucleotidyltransferase with HDIG domain
LVLSLGLVYAFSDLGPAGWILSFIPLLGLVYAFRAYSRQRELAENLERFSLEIAASMVTALDLKDNYTARHSAAVAMYSYDMTKAMGLTDEECNLALLAGLLHDLGKISVPDELLNRRERLEQEDWDLIQDHCSAGQTILSHMREFKELGEVVLYHHEHYDGMGYPQGKAGEEIPLLSRVVSAADAYSAMTSDRPYRSRRTPLVAMAELDRRRGTQFDPRVVGHFLDVLDAGSDSYRRGEGEEFDLQSQFKKVRYLRDIV